MLFGLKGYVRIPGQSGGLPAALWLVVVLALAQAGAAQQAAPLVHAHAHNDYEHARPLHDALEHGFTSVEADVFLVAGELLVGHEFGDLEPGRSLRALYLEPLRERTRHNGGRVYPGGPPFTLLIDIKTEAEATYLALHEVLAGYADLLTSFGPDGRHDGPVLAIVSGNRPLELMAGQTLRYAAYDGRLVDLGFDAPAALIPLISDRWTSHFAWAGVGPMPEAEREKLRSIVQEAHAEGRRVRFWATPDAPGAAREAVWLELLTAGVDLINTDDLAGLQRFLLERE